MGKNTSSGSSPVISWDEYDKESVLPEMTKPLNWSEPVGYYVSLETGISTVLDIKVLNIPVEARAILSFEQEDAGDLDDVRLLAERAAEVHAPHAEVKARLRRDGLLPD